MVKVKLTSSCPSCNADLKITGKSSYHGWSDEHYKFPVFSSCPKCKESLFFKRGSFSPVHIKKDSIDFMTIIKLYKFAFGEEWKVNLDGTMQGKIMPYTNFDELRERIFIALNHLSKRGLSILMRHINGQSKESIAKEDGVGKYSVHLNLEKSRIFFHRNSLGLHEYLKPRKVTRNEYINYMNEVLNVIEDIDCSARSFRNGYLETPEYIPEPERIPMDKLGKKPKREISYGAYHYWLGDKKEAIKAALDSKLE